MPDVGGVAVLGAPTGGSYRPLCSCCMILSRGQREEGKGAHQYLIPSLTWNCFMSFDLFAASLWESRVTPCLPRIRDPEETCNYVRCNYNV